MGELPRRRLGVLALLGLGSLSACELALGIHEVPEPDETATEAGALDGTTDRGTVPEASAASDGPLDVNAEEADVAPPADAMVDGTQAALPDGSDAGVGFCASQTTAHALCADFDVGAYNAQFSYVAMTANASLAADSTSFVSAPNSLWAQLPQAPSVGDYAWLDRLFVGTASTVTYTFDVRVDAWPATTDLAVLASIHVNESSSSTHELALLAGVAGAGLQETFLLPDGGASYPGHQMSQTVTLGQWTTVQITVDFVTHTCGVTLNGTNVLASAPIDPSWTTGTPSVRLGIEYTSSQVSPWAIRFDNVLVDWQ